MRKNKKQLILATFVLLGCSSGLGAYNAHATVRSKIGNFLSNLVNRPSIISRVATTPNIENPKSILDTLKLKPTVKGKIKSLIDSGNISGTNVGEFIVKDISKIESKNLYYQNVDKNGKLVTIVSSNFPKITDVNEKIVNLEYTDTSGKKQNLLNEGVPLWVKGSDIIDFNSTTKNLLDFYTVEAPDKLKNPIRKLINNNETNGMNIEEFVVQNIDDIENNNLYYQRRESDGNLHTYISKDIPKVTDVSEGILTTEFTNTRGEKEKVYSRGLPLWLEGDLIRNKYDERLAENLADPDLDPFRNLD